MSPPTTTNFIVYSNTSNTTTPPSTSFFVPVYPYTSYSTNLLNIIHNVDQYLPIFAIVYSTLILTMYLFQFCKHKFHISSNQNITLHYIGIITSFILIIYGLPLLFLSFNIYINNPINLECYQSQRINFTYFMFVKYSFTWTIVFNLSDIVQNPYTNPRYKYMTPRFHRFLKHFFLFLKYILVLFFAGAIFGAITHIDDSNAYIEEINGEKYCLLFFNWFDYFWTFGGDIIGMFMYTFLFGRNAFSCTRLPIVPKGYNENISSILQVNNQAKNVNSNGNHTYTNEPSTSEVGGFETKPVFVKIESESRKDHSFPIGMSPSSQKSEQLLLEDLDGDIFKKKNKNKKKKEIRKQYMFKNEINSKAYKKKSASNFSSKKDKDAQQKKLNKQKIGNINDDSHDLKTKQEEINGLKEQILVLKVVWIMFITYWLTIVGYSFFGNTASIGALLIIIATTGIFILNDQEFGSNYWYSKDKICGCCCCCVYCGKQHVRFSSFNQGDDPYKTKKYEAKFKYITL